MGKDQACFHAPSLRVRESDLLILIYFDYRTQSIKERFSRASLQLLHQQDVTQSHKWNALRIYIALQYLGEVIDVL